MPTFTLDIPITADATLVVASPATNFGAESTITTERGGKAGELKRAILKATIAIPAGATLTACSLWVELPDTTQVDGDVRIYRNVDAWDELSVTYATAPAIDGTNLFTVTVAGGGLGIAIPFEFTHANMLALALDAIANRAGNLDLSLLAMTGLTLVTMTSKDGLGTPPFYRLTYTLPSPVRTMRGVRDTVPLDPRSPYRYA